ncbi:MAG: NnrS family protein, partial [Chthoniobacteraceae bacterium]
DLRTWGIVRACLAIAYVVSRVPLYSPRVPGATVAQFLRAGFVILLAGMFVPAAWPGQRIAGLHLVFVGGYTVITFCIATRVVLGHSGQGGRVQQRLPFLFVTMILLLVGGTLRVWGDFLPEARPSMLNAASYLWMLAAVVWGWRLLPAVRIPDSES